MLMKLCQISSASILYFVNELKLTEYLAEPGITATNTIGTLQKNRIIPIKL